MADIDAVSTTRSLSPSKSPSTKPSPSRTASSFGNSGGRWLPSSRLTWKLDDTTCQFVPGLGWPGWSPLRSVTNGPPGIIAASPGTSSPSAAYDTRYFTSAADAAHDTTDDRRDRRPAGHEREPGSTHGDEVGVEVDEIVPAGRIGEVGAAVGRRHEDDVVDRGGPVRLRQNGFHERSGDQTAAAVGDDVDRQVGAGVLAPQLGEQVVGVLPGVDAQRPVVVADDGVVGGEHRREEALGTRHEAHRRERTDRRREGAVDEQQHSHRTVCGQRRGCRPAPSGCHDAADGPGDVDESRTHGLLELAHDVPDDEGDGEAQHDRLHRTVNEVAEQSTVVGLLGAQAARPATRPGRGDVGRRGCTSISKVSVRGRATAFHRWAAAEGARSRRRRARAARRRHRRAARRRRRSPCRDGSPGPATRGRGCGAV